jgi:MarR family transcriptional regulator for hemolysin
MQIALFIFAKTALANIIRQLIMSLDKRRSLMPQASPNREMVFMINDVARMLRTLADQEVRKFGMTRAQWAVLARLQRHEGLKQSELAEILDLQPITLTRLIDRLADNGLIERRPDPSDRRAKRLFLTAAAKPLMDRLSGLGGDLMTRVLDGIPAEQTAATLGQLEAMKENLRRALQGRDEAASTEARHYG